MRILTSDTEKHRNVLAIQEIFADMIGKVNKALMSNGYTMDVYVVTPDGNMYLAGSKNAFWVDKEPGYDEVEDHQHNNDLIGASMIEDSMDMYMQDNGLDDYRVKVVVTR